MKLFLFFSMLIFLLIILNKNSWSQEIPKGTLIIHVAPQKAIIYIDSAKKENHDQVKLTEGMHHLKIWAPDRQLVIDTVSIFKDSTLVYIKTLPFSDEYAQYRKDKANYLLAKTVPPAFTVISTAILATSYSHNKKLSDQYYDDAKLSEENFNSTFAVTTLDSSKTSFNKAKESYEHYHKKANAAVIAGAIILPIGIGTSVYFFIRSQKPYYHETPLLSRINGDLFFAGSGGTTVSLTYKF